MITALDSSVILDVLVDDPVWKSRSLTALRLARAEGRLIISEMVLAEISPALKGNSVGEFLADWELEFEPCGLDAAVHAGECFSRYAGDFAWREAGPDRGQLSGCCSCAASRRPIAGSR